MGAVPVEASREAPGAAAAPPVLRRAPAVGVAGEEGKEGASSAAPVRVAQGWAAPRPRRVGDTGDAGSTPSASGPAAGAARALWAAARCGGE
jgi:hypothetical protein